MTTNNQIFDDFRDMPEEFKTHLGVFEDMIGDLDGKTLATAAADNTFIDEGTIVADDYVGAFNGIVAAMRASTAREAALREALEKIASEPITGNLHTIARAALKSPAA